MSVLSKLLKFARPIRKTKEKATRTLGKAFNEYLLFTNVVSSAVLMAIGDFIQQEIEYQLHALPKRYDFPRMGRMAAVGLGYGVFHHYFYTGLDRLWPTPNVICTIKKILVDQLTLSPLCIVYFFYFAGLLEGKDLSGCAEELKEKFWDVYLIDWILWPPTQFINFLYVPARYQVVYINIITTFYNVFLSYIKHDKIVTKKKSYDNLERDKEKNDEIEIDDGRKKHERSMDYKKKRRKKIVKE